MYCTCTIIPRVCNSSQNYILRGMRNMRNVFFYSLWFWRIKGSDHLAHSWEKPMYSYGNFSAFFLWSPPWKLQKKVVQISSNLERRHKIKKEAYAENLSCLSHWEPRNLSRPPQLWARWSDPFKVSCHQTFWKINIFLLFCQYASEVLG